jgi:hypothetical protein
MSLWDATEIACPVTLKSTALPQKRVLLVVVQHIAHCQRLVVIIRQIFCTPLKVLPSGM